jgi:cell division protease FtsH
MLEDERKLTAYHEAGHALLALITEGSDPIYKATIVPRGSALGLVMRLPENDRVSVNKKKLLADLIVGMGGRAAEEIIFGHEKITSGASSDIKMVSKLSRAMVCEWGMSDKVGMIFYGDSESDNVYSSGGGLRSKISNKTLELIDSEIKELIDWAYDKALCGINSHKDWLEIIASNLLEKETLDLFEIKKILGIESEEKEIQTDDSPSEG